MRKSLKFFGWGFAPDPVPDGLVTLLHVVRPGKQARESMVPSAKKTWGKYVL